MPKVGQKGVTLDRNLLDPWTVAHEVQRIREEVFELRAEVARLADIVGKDRKFLSSSDLLLDDEIPF